MKVNIKPLSINQAFQGRKFKTKTYKDYEKELLLKLKDLEIKDKVDLKLTATVGYSNKLADIDNFLKPFVDILQKRYGFNDRYIYELHITKEITKKGEEFIEFEIDEIK